MPTENKSSYILHRYLQLLRNECPKPCRIQHSGHPDHALPRQPSLLECRLRHRIQRVRHDNQNRVRRRRDSLRHHIAHNLEVRIQQIVAAHPRLPRNPRRNHNDIRILRVRIVIGPNDIDIPFLNRHSLQQVQRLALRYTLHHIEQHNVGQFLRCNPVRSRRPNVPCPNNRYLLPHHLSLLCRLKSLAISILESAARAVRSLSASVNEYRTEWEIDDGTPVTTNAPSTPCSRSCDWQTRSSSPSSLPASRARSRRSRTSAQSSSPSSFQSAAPPPSIPESRTA